MCVSSSPQETGAQGACGEQSDGNVGSDIAESLSPPPEAWQADDYDPANPALIVAATPEQEAKEVARLRALQAVQLEGAIRTRMRLRHNLRGDCEDEEGSATIVLHYRGVLQDLREQVQGTGVEARPLRERTRAASPPLATEDFREKLQATGVEALETAASPDGAARGASSVEGGVDPARCTRHSASGPDATEPLARGPRRQDGARAGGEAKVRLRYAVWRIWKKGARVHQARSGKHRPKRARARATRRSLPPEEAPDGPRSSGPMLLQRRVQTAQRTLTTACPMRKRVRSKSGGLQLLFGSGLLPRPCKQALEAGGGGVLKGAALLSFAAWPALVH